MTPSGKTPEGSINPFFLSVLRGRIQSVPNIDPAGNHKAMLPRKGRGLVYEKDRF
jgi:hypothetical protein